ncbi:MAG: DUF58 domain-containing protein [Firmicutes bacterium]|nr:DUF58 domain-containing protein [Bacillota bacterium]
MKNKKIKASIRPRGTVIIYFFFMFSALVFMHALRSTISSVLLVFTAALLPVSLLYSIILSKSIKIDVQTKAKEFHKNDIFQIFADIKNLSPLPMPFSSAHIIMPSSEGPECIKKRVRFSVMPFSVCRLSDEAEFRFRGEYRLGLVSVETSDLFNLFNIRIKVSALSLCYVLPRVSAIPETVAGRAESGERAGTDPVLSASSERSGTREYRLGDSMKNIHWKLSSKAQELIVRPETAGADATVAVFIDYTTYVCAPFKEEMDGEKLQKFRNALCDAVADAAASVIACIAECKGTCMIYWLDARHSNSVRADYVDSPEMFWLKLRNFGTAPAYKSVKNPFEEFVQNSSGEYSSRIFITSRTDSDAAEALITAAAVSGNSIDSTVIIADAASFFDDESKRKKYSELCSVCASELAGAGINTVIF